MKRILFAVAAVAAVAGTAAEVTNFVGTVATKQQILAMVCPAYDVSWETEILQDTEGEESVYPVGPHCADVIASWMANSTTNEFSTVGTERFKVNGHGDGFKFGYDGTMRLGVEDYEENKGESGYNRPIITIVEKEVADGAVRIKWRYYRWNNLNGRLWYRECTMKMTATPRWRWATPTPTATP